MTVRAAVCTKQPWIKYQTLACAPGHEAHWHELCFIYLIDSSWGLPEMKRFASIATLIAAASIAQATEVPAEKTGLAAVDGHPLTSVVITQCNLIVAVYLTMPDGRLLRFDKSADVPADKMISMAYTAVRSERVEVACEANGIGAVGFEKHDAL